MSIITIMKKSMSITMIMRKSMSIITIMRKSMSIIMIITITTITTAMMRMKYSSVGVLRRPANIQEKSWIAA